MKWMYVNFQELWMFCQKGETTKAVPLNAVATKIETTVIDVLLALHALTAALKIADTDIIHNLVTLGKTDINTDTITTTEKFLVRCTDSKVNSENFDELQMEYYHHNKTFNLKKISPTHTSIYKHIQRAFLQIHISDTGEILSTKYYHRFITEIEFSQV